MLYKITGVDKAGASKTLVCEANEERLALQFAKSKGVHPTKVVQVKRTTKESAKTHQQPEQELDVDAAFDAAMATVQSTESRNEPATTLPTSSNAPFQVTQTQGVSYDPIIIHQYATKMYAEADKVIINCTIIGGVAFGTAALILLQALNNQPKEISVLLIAIFASFGLYVGYGYGRSRAFWCKFAAQQALCQAQIEANTHK